MIGTSRNRGLEQEQYREESILGSSQRTQLAARNSKEPILVNSLGTRLTTLSGLNKIPHNCNSNRIVNRTVVSTPSTTRDILIINLLLMLTYSFE